MFIVQMLDMDWMRIVEHLSRLVFAYLLALPIGWEREVSERHFGLRTFPLVAVVTCGFMLIGLSVIDDAQGKARVIQGIITGIGFIGGGAIVKDRDEVSGVSSAAGIWNTGAIGMAVAFDRYEIAVLLAAVNVFTLYVFGSVKKTVNAEDEHE